MPDLLLGLIGENIARSHAPTLHRLAGRLCGLEVRYDLLAPGETGGGFEGGFQHAATGGYRGVNVTHPYKERAAARVTVENPLVRAIGAVNTVIFGAGGPKGYNTDHTGFVAAMRAAFGRSPADAGAVVPGPVCLIGTGGAGKAVAFGLVALGVEELRLVDLDAGKAAALARALTQARAGLRVRCCPGAADAAEGAAGLVNCTPIGMTGYGGTPLPRARMHGAFWAFDAVYTPVHSPFLADAAAEGLRTVSGYELFFHQGVDAWRLFSGREVDAAALRVALGGETAAA